MSLYLEHVNTVLGKLREAPITALSTDTTTEAFRAQVAVKRAVARVWNAKQWSFKTRSYALSTVSGTLSYALPPYVGEIFSVKVSSAPYVVSVLPESQFDKYLPNPTETGCPRYVRLFDMSGALGQPAAAGVAAIVSSSASDTTQKVLVKGIVGGYVDTEELSLSGTGTVTGSKSFSEVTAVTKSAETVGKVTVTIGSTTIATIAPAETVHRRRFIRCYPTPDAAYTLTLKHFGASPNLSNAYEDTEIPTRWDYVVDQFAFALALQSKGKEQAEEFAAQFDVATKFLQTDMATEEYIASEEIITPQRWGNNSGELSQWGSLPDGYGYTYPL